MTLSDLDQAGQAIEDIPINWNDPRKQDKMIFLRFDI
jgi:hypothetical protein